ncbi:alpha/beta hydrolase [Mariprofundus sp. EBB-1]|uniref:alpha/beta hydrolase n=1 Tax=Mariprofundus sp. EBB-1 TaxID=2650971 RepID=UPI00137B19AF|nr:alpha/beta hydrolase [Mariprofundus sp. EBB-1]
MEKEKDFNPVDYSKLIALIYDTAEDTSLWPELLEQIWDYANSDSSHFHDKDAIFEPHVARAVALNQRISKLKAKNYTSNQILNRLPIGVLVVNEALKILAVNERASMVLNHGKVISNKYGFIESHSIKNTQQLQKLVATYASSSSFERGSSLFLEGSDGAQISLWVTASDNQATEITGSSDVAIIYIASPLIQPEFDVQNIQDQFHLTLAEAKLVKALANGCHNLNDAAIKLGVSIHTVRTQIKRTFEKTDTTSQMELVKKVLTSPSAIFGETQLPQSLISHADAEKDVLFKPYHTIRLMDGRDLSYEEYGDPEGIPVLLFHAAFGSRLQYPADDTTAHRLGLRFIVPDRPGHGYSSMQKDRKLLDWPNDVIALADQLNLETFSVMGYSGGGSYALACAYKIPERIDQAVLVSFGSPNISFYENSLRWSYSFLRMAQSSPKLFSQFVKILASSFQKDPIKALERRFSQMAPVDMACIENDPANREQYALSLNESLRQGGEGVAQDMMTIMDWDFTPKNVSMPIRFWHGVEDQQFPLRAAKQLVEELPDCEATFVPKAGSMLIIQHWDEILIDLAGRLSIR